MRFQTEKFSFSFDSEIDDDIISFIQQIPKGKRSNMIRKVFRNYIQHIKRPIPAEGLRIKKCHYCNGIGSTDENICPFCEGKGRSDVS